MYEFLISQGLTSQEFILYTMVFFFFSFLFLKAFDKIAKGGQWFSSRSLLYYFKTVSRFVVFENGWSFINMWPPNSLTYFCSVTENTKEYICRAVVTVVDHLGSASANLDCRISQTNAFSEAEFRISCLKQVSSIALLSHITSFRYHWKIIKY